MKGSTLLIVGSAIVIGFFYRDFTGKSLTESISAGENSSSINAALIKSAKKQNNKLPMKFGNGQEWLSVSAGNMRMTNNYRFESSYPTRNSLYADTRNAVCSDPYTRKLIDNGVTLEYVYIGRTNKHLFQFSINRQQCQ